MRCSRWLPVVGVLVCLPAAAGAVSLAVSLRFTGTSKHRHYGITLLPECFTTGCTKATTLGVQITTGRPKHPAAKCVYGTFQLPNTKIRKNGAFSITGEGSTVSRTFKLRVSGVFTSPRRVHGTIAGPKACGGTDRFRLTATG